MKHKFVLRKIRQGKVKIAGRWYEPSSQWLRYDGRLDGQRFLFGRYDGKPELVCLWGSEADYKNSRSEEDFESDNVTLVDGYFVWYWWHSLDTDILIKE